jgi:DNA-directed RNA polymerase subunit RPC12/RpoP
LAEEANMALVKTAGSRCRRCGADAFGKAAPYVYRVHESSEEGERDLVLHLCSACAQDFANDRERDQYVRLGVLA